MAGQGDGGGTFRSKNREGKEKENQHERGVRNRLKGPPTCKILESSPGAIPQIGSGIAEMKYRF